MISVVSKTGESIEFTEEEIALSVLLTTCLEIDENKTIPLPRVGIDELILVKKLSTAIVSTDDMSTVDMSIIDITTDFTVENLFSLLDASNFLENIVIVKLIKNRISSILLENKVDEILKIFNLRDFTDMEKSQMTLLGKFVY